MRPVALFPLALLLLSAGLLAASFAGRGGRPDAELPFDATRLTGEVTQTSALLQARLALRDSTVGQLPGFGDVPGFAGWGRLAWSADSLFKDVRRTGWMRAMPEHDFILKKKISGLQPGTRYWWRVEAGRDSADVVAGRTSTFRTLPERASREEVDFVMISCGHYERFYGLHDPQGGGAEPATGADSLLGFPAFEAVLALRPDFWISNGDNVYYDHPRDHPATTREELRAKWHRQFAMPRLRAVADRLPVYFLKDDHDYRFNDADTTGEAPPPHPLGVDVFREQVPVVDPADPEAETYRTYRVNGLVQLWMLEGRDYRSPNSLPDVPGKTLWGERQEAWLKRTLLASDAPFKLIVSPTPLVGPDDAYKRDNHTNPGGFRAEGTAFIDWLAEHALTGEVFVLNGDRHWQYHSVHPSGLEEFGSGAFVAQNARQGREPGDPESTDPEGLIDQPYIQEVPTGGFLHVTAEASEAGGRPSILFAHYDERGRLLYAARRYGAPLTSPDE